MCSRQQEAGDLNYFPSVAISTPGRMGVDWRLLLLEARIRMSEYQYYEFGAIDRPV